MKNEKTKAIGTTAEYWVKAGYTYGIDEAPEGMTWVCSAMNSVWILEDTNTNYCCSASSESYWCS